MVQARYASEIDGIKFDPPVPIAVVEIQHPFQTSGFEIRCIVDTGSYRTAIPKNVLSKVGFPCGTSSDAKLLDGGSKTIELYHVDLLLCNKRCRRLGLGTGPMKVLMLKEGQIPVLGRDVLNQFRLTLDGECCTVERKS